MPANGHKHQLDGFAGEPVESVRSNGTRTFAPGFTAALARHCRGPGVSVADAALAHGVFAAGHTDMRKGFDPWLHARRFLRRMSRSTTRASTCLRCSPNAASRPTQSSLRWRSWMRWHG
jgi:hypothetical protein